MKNSLEMNLNLSLRSTTVKSLIVCLFTLLIACEPEDPKRYISEGKKLLKQGDLESARVQFQNALQLDSGLSDAYFQLALVAEKNNNWRGMLNNLLDTVAIDPTHLEGQTRLGQVYLLAGEFDKAVEQAKIIQNLAPKNLSAYLLQAAANLQQAKNDEALQGIDYVLLQKPYFADAIALKVAYLVKLKQNKKAIYTLNEGIKYNPDNRNLRLLKIRIDINNKQFNRAVSEYKSLLVKNPEDDNLRSLLVDALLLADQREQAEILLGRLIDRQPTQINLKLKFIKLVEQRDKSLVEAVLREFIAESPEDLLLKTLLVDQLIFAGQWQQAEAILVDIVKSEGDSPNGLAAKIKIANIAISQKNKGKLVKWVTEVLKVDASHTEGLLLRAGLRLDEKDADGAITDLRIVLGNRPSSEQAMIFLAKANVMQGEIDVAKNQLRKVLAINPSNLKALIPLSYALFKQGDYEQAAKVIADAKKAKPDSSKITELKIQLLFAKKDWQGAAKAISELQKQAATLWRARLASKQGQYKQAIQIYKNILNETPNNQAILLALGQISQKAGKNTQLISYLKELIANKPEVDAAYYTLALTYIHSHKSIEAEQLIKQKLKHNDKDMQAYLLLVRAYIKQGKQAEIEQTYLTALTKVDNKLAMMNELAKFYLIQQKYAKSIEMYKKIFERNPDNDEVANNLADLLVTHQGDDKASIEQAVQLVNGFNNASNPMMRDTYGWVLLKSGEIQQALLVLKKLADTKPNNARVLYHLAEAYYQNGDSESARDVLNRSLAIRQTEQQGGFGFIEIASVKALKQQLDAVKH